MAASSPDSYTRTIYLTNEVVGEVDDKVTVTTRDAQAEIGVAGQ